MNYLVLTMAASIVILTAVRAYLGSDEDVRLSAFDPKPYCVREAY